MEWWIKVQKDKNGEESRWRREWIWI